MNIKGISLGLLLVILPVSFAWAESVVDKGSDTIGKALPRYVELSVAFLMVKAKSEHLGHDSGLPKEDLEFIRSVAEMPLRLNSESQRVWRQACKQLVSAEYNLVEVADILTISDQEFYEAQERYYVGLWGQLSPEGKRAVEYMISNELPEITHSRTDWHHELKTNPKAVANLQHSCRQQ